VLGATGVNLVIAVKLVAMDFKLEQGSLNQQHNLEENHVMVPFHHLNLATIKVVQVSFLITLKSAPVLDRGRTESFVMTY